MTPSGNRTGPLQRGSAKFCAVLFLMLWPLLCGGTASEGASSTALAEALKAHLRATCPWPEIEIGEVTVSEPVESRAPLRIFVDRNPPGRVPFTAEFDDGKKVSGSVLVKAYDRVVVSARAHRKGYVMQESDVYTALMEVSRIPKGALKESQAVEGKSLSRAVAANVPVLDAMIREMPLVKRGHRVTILAETPSMSITTFGELKADSLVGSHVKVLNLQSKKIVSGVLADENTVKVDF